jgi:hypothetical protein
MIDKNSSVKDVLEYMKIIERYDEVMKQRDDAIRKGFEGVRTTFQEVDKIINALTTEIVELKHRVKQLEDEKNTINRW